MSSSVTTRLWRFQVTRLKGNPSPQHVLRAVDGQPRWALFLPQGPIWVGWGLQAAVQAHGRDRFQHLKEAWSAWRQCFALDAFGDFPLFFAASFAPREPASPWSPAFPNALLAVPKGVVGWFPHGQTLMWTLEGAPSQAGFERAEGDDEKAMDRIPPVEEWHEGLSREAWEAMIDRALQVIARGELRKVVLARYRRLRFAGELDPTTVLFRLRRRYPDTAVFLYEPIPGWAFVGATPEVLLVKEGEKIQTVALAGSIRRGATPQEDQVLAQRLLSSSKDLREHAWVVRAVVEGLRPWVEDLQVPRRPRLRTLPNIHHLETPIHARGLRGDLLDLVASLHPTPALGGWPKDLAQAFLQAEEPFDRGWYAGPLGYLTPAGDGRVFVAIRSALIVGREAWLYAGAGIVSGSHPAKEWDEVNLKFRPMMEVLRGQT